MIQNLHQFKNPTARCYSKYTITPHRKSSIIGKDHSLHGTNRGQEPYQQGSMDRDMISKESYPLCSCPRLASSALASSCRGPKARLFTMPTCLRLHVRHMFSGRMWLLLVRATRGYCNKQRQEGRGKGDEQEEGGQILEVGKRTDEKVKKKKRCGWNKGMHTEREEKCKRKNVREAR